MLPDQRFVLSLQQPVGNGEVVELRQPVEQRALQAQPGQGLQLGLDAARAASCEARPDSPSRPFWQARRRSAAGVRMRTSFSSISKARSLPARSARSTSSGTVTETVVRVAGGSGPQAARRNPAAAPLLPMRRRTSRGSGGCERPADRLGPSTSKNDDVAIRRRAIGARPAVSSPTASANRPIRRSISASSTWATSRSRLICA